MNRPDAVVIVGESIAGLTAARELRRRGYAGSLTMIGRDPEGAYARPPLSKEVLREATYEAHLSYSHADLDLAHVRSAAVGLDASSRTVTTADGRFVPYDALLIATGADARRLARPAQTGELVLRTLADARLIRRRIECARSAIVVGAGFLGLEVASACSACGVEVTVVDSELPLLRHLGPFVSEHVGAHLTRHGVRLIQAAGHVHLVGDPVTGVALPDGSTQSADLVITCAGDVPAVAWLSGTGLADSLGVAIDEQCSTSIPGVYAAGDVAYLTPGTGERASRAPFWSNAVAQGKVAAASILGEPRPHPPKDDYFWTEILGLPIKVVGPLPVNGDPTSIEGDVDAGDAVLRWESSGAPTVVAYGRKIPVGRLRTMTTP
ncbi:NAD(P)/FAD-dependent oxidoreductase [Nocardioides luteus]|uniref:NAD(P)/FAD-dependent oxidoreductase n=1 Tax=Nocardioides luteus TaxID=1844 RepID=UPI0018C9DC5E|nr:FAD-dependent oxidoreductase [Nocardioides luteus]MBG6096885.1 NADPH-dependent 2,4-dienoyl-CoA reductase/sulfur reductase-like enzyme [Nocardioides luteus]